MAQPTITVGQPVQDGQAIPMAQPVVTVGQAMPGVDAGADYAPGAPPAAVLSAAHPSGGGPQGYVAMRGTPDPDQTSFKDKYWGLGLLGSTLVTLILALALGAPSLSGSSSDDDGGDDSGCTSDFCDQAGDAMGILVGLVFASGAAAAFWVGLCLYYAHAMVHLSLGLFVGYILLILIGLLAAGGTVGAVFVILLVVLLMWWWNKLRRYVPFAAANLSVACRAVSAHKWTVGVSLLMCLAQLVWAVVWILAYLGAEASAEGEIKTSTTTYTSSDCGDATTGTSDSCVCSNSDDSDVFDGTCDENLGGGLAGIVVLILLFMYYWTSIAIRYIVHTTTCGTVACWWFQQGNETAVSGSFKRATTTSLGSVAFGAAVIAFIRVLRYLARSQRRSIVGCILGCLLRYLEAFIEFLNAYAFCYVAMYGKEFLPAGREVMNLLKERGFTAVLSDGLIDLVLGLGVFCVACFSGWLGYAMSEGADLDVLWVVILCLLGVIMGWILASQVLGTIGSAVKAIFVCFAEDPAGLGAHEPEAQQKMLNEWAKLHPQGFVYAVLVRQGTVPQKV